MTHQQHNDPDLPRPALPRRRVLQALLGGTLTLAGLAGCGGGDDEAEDDGEEQDQQGDQDQDQGENGDD